MDQTGQPLETILSVQDYEHWVKHGNASEEHGEHASLGEGGGGGAAAGDVGLPPALHAYELQDAPQVPPFILSFQGASSLHACWDLCYHKSVRRAHQSLILM